MLKEREQFKPRQPRNLLTGILVDGFGRRMVARDVYGGPANGRYYSSAFTAWATRQRIRPMRIRAEAIEQLVLQVLKRQMSDRTILRPLLIRAGYHGLQIDELSDEAAAAALRFDRLTIVQLSGALKGVLQRVEVASDRVFITLRVGALAELIASDGVGLFSASDVELSRPGQVHVEEVAVAMARERRKDWLPLMPHAGVPTPCAKLLALLEDA
ncbi:hypothetical protein OKW76_01560 [Sphingomonas sp. S1-29]|uniref:hypothetical protein n=1 Tax=Sphingomonas sp. S1-29 TaxID=2991074 RepID=UPI002240488F|nr:hypothetical protein [Sphingomonas sp. S1-29]UZK69781.1 hypothetical protein OKW76_01560 [Sphingomonas sp. S1-29]